MSSLLAKYSLVTVARVNNVTRQHAPIRLFHTPFVALNQSHVQQAQQQKAEAQTTPFTYEKHYDVSYEPLATSSGHRTYVVSQPDMSARYYEVPSGAYPTSSPYEAP